MENSQDSVNRLLPLTPAVFHILLALADAPRHGYGIMKEVAQRTQGTIRMGPGTLYGTLKRMQVEGLVSESEETNRGVIGDDRRRFLIVSEVALAFVLMVAGGLLFQTLGALQAADLGFRPKGVLSFRIDLPATRYSAEQAAPLFAELEERIAALPEVVAVGANLQLPLGPSSWSGTDTFYDPTGGSAPLGREHFEVDQRVVTPGYFRALGTALVRGRFFTPRDDRNSPTRSAGRPGRSRCESPWVLPPLECWDRPSALPWVWPELV